MARLLVLFAASEFVLLPIPIITLFWKDQIGMSLTDIMVVRAAFGLSVALFQPSWGLMLAEGATSSRTPGGSRPRQA